jgi:anti-anti-sigma factor
MPPAPRKGRLNVVQITKQGDVIWIEGEVDMASADDLRAVLRDNDTGPLILDASNLTFMDSSGLRVLLETAASRNGNGDLILRRPQRSLRRLLEIAVPDGIDGLQVQG